ncbi:MAG: peptidylprolyl isomerase [Flavobacteriaceae bacterium]|nr:MAG: peptidylprolyl isomerase [Flavobacteriaceae bacterium]
MRTQFKLTLTLLIVIYISSCKSISPPIAANAEARTSIEMLTTKGSIIIELYNETPLHRDNFIKLVQERTYDSLLFHRVIGQFMIQAGDPDSKFAKPEDTIGFGGLDYKIDAEFRPNLFHKKGVLAAARDGNLKRASSAIQFYIVQGKVLNDSLIDRNERRINESLARHYARNDPNNKSLLDAIQKARDDQDRQRFIQLNDSLNFIARAYSNFDYYVIPDAHRKVYKTIGGTPHLDQNYTVFGEVVQGIDLVDAIAAVPTGVFNRPIEDVRIIEMRILKN